MGVITQSIARQGAIAQANAAEMAVMNANRAQSSLLGSKAPLSEISRRETAIELDKEQAALKAKVAKAQAEALKTSKNKIDYFA